MPAIALFAARVVYAFNWYNVGAVLPLIGSGLAAGPAALGIVLGAFLVGVGLFQVPAGVAAIKWGARRVSMVGLGVLGAACLLSAFAPNWPTLAAIRFVAGVGAAFFFSPALSLIASYFPAGRRGPVIGFYNGGFSIGGAIGLFAGAAVGLSLGWRVALGSGGAAMLIATLLCSTVLPPDSTGRAEATLRDLWSAARPILRSRSIWALSLSLTGFWGAVYIVAQYFVAYSVDIHPSWGLGLAAGLVGLVVLVSFPGGPVGGWLGERRFERRRVLFVFGALSGLLVITVPFLGLGPLAAVLLGLGFFDGIVFAILYLIPTYLPESRGEGLALGVAIVNSIQVGIGSGLAVAFGYLVALDGYTVAWVVAGGLAIALLPLLTLVPSTQPDPSTASAPATGGSA